MARMMQNERDSHNMKTAVIGIGNLLYQDEGVGVHVVNNMMARYGFPPECTIIDGGTKGLELLPMIEEQDAIIMVDAVDFGEKPGFIKVIEDQDMKAYLDLKFSVHQIGIPDMLFAMEFKGIKPPKICLIGIQPPPEEFEMKPRLTPVIAARLDELIELTVERLRAWGVPVETKKPEDYSELPPEYRHVSGDPIENN